MENIKFSSDTHESAGGSDQSEELIPTQKTLDELKEIYKQRLDSVLYKELTVENIKSFANDALSDLEVLVQSILKEYKNNPFLEADISLTTREQEDLACKKLELPDIQDILQSIIDKKEEIDSLGVYLCERLQKIDEVITPPNQDSQRTISAGEIEKLEAKRLFPRLLTLMYILKNDMGVDPEECVVTEGVVAPQMMRQTPYVRIEIPRLDRLVYVCDEEGNASYVFDTKILAENGIGLESIDLDSKDEKNEIIENNPGIGIRIIQSKYWRDKIFKLLDSSLPKALIEGDSDFTPMSSTLKSEFEKDNKEILQFDYFQKEVEALYPGGNINAWYKIEYKKHDNWPCNPQRRYKDAGWIGWFELVGRENVRKKEYLSFDDFAREVISSYQGQTSVERWYGEEYKKHKGWPSAPHITYKDAGWIGWKETIGVIKESPAFKDFVGEVVAAYPGTGDVSVWYRKEYKKHSNWPSEPKLFYKDKGWVSFANLVGKELRRKAEDYILFEDFVKEVRASYSGAPNIIEWFRGEYKKHKRWPTKPEKVYASDGWVSYPELVGREFISFGDLKKEVKTLFAQSNVKNVMLWYREEYKKHKGWPSSPDKMYENDGWVGWSDLVK